MAVIISPTNPIRFDTSLDYPFGYTEEFQKCYPQKYERADFTRLQIRTDEETIPKLQVLNAVTGGLVYEFDFEIVPTLIADQTFKICDCEVVFAELDEGDYILKIANSYSNVISVKNKHKDTMLIRYQNSTNNFGIVFDTGIYFFIRVEGLIQNYTPKNDDQIYNDQLRNATKLYGLPYNTFTIFIGSPKGVGDYMLDMVNRAFSCDMVKVDNVWYEKTESGGEWDMSRVDNYAFGAMSTEIMPAQNKVMDRLVIDEDLNDNETMIIQRYSNNFFNHTGNINLSNVFVKNCVLDYISVKRKSLPYTLKVGETEGGSEIAEIEVIDLEQIITIRHRFDGPQTLYLSGMEGENDISIVWDRCDKFFNPQSTEPQPASTLSKGATIMWHGSMEDFEIQFNTVTGLGKIDGDWYGWAIHDGQNGTVDMSGKVGVGWSKLDAVFDNIGEFVGSNTKPILIQHLPPHRFNLFSDQTQPPSTTSDLTTTSFVAKGTNTTGGGMDEKYAMRRAGAVEPSLGRTNSIGGGVSFNVLQASAIFAYIKRIM